MKLHHAWRAWSDNHKPARRYSKGTIGRLWDTWCHNLSHDMVSRQSAAWYIRSRPLCDHHARMSSLTRAFDRMKRKDTKWFKEALDMAVTTPSPNRKILCSQSKLVPDAFTSACRESNVAATGLKIGVHAPNTLTNGIPFTLASEKSLVDRLTNLGQRSFQFSCNSPPPHRMPELFDSMKRSCFEYHNYTDWSGHECRSRTPRSASPQSHHSWSSLITHVL